MGNGQKTFHKIREFAEVALNILGGLRGASWLLGHSRTYLESRVVVVCPKSQCEGYFLSLLESLGEKPVAVFQGYFDESERAGGIFCIAGYIFAPRQAKKFTKDWSQLFGAYPGGLHMRDLTQRTRSFRGIGAEDQKHLITEAARIIKRRITAGFAVSCNVNEVQAVGPKWIRGFRHAYPLCCHLCMTAVGKFLEASGSEDRVTYVFESGHPRESEARTFLQSSVLDPVAKESYRHSGDAFLPKSDATPLQAADMLAWEWAKFRDETIERPVRLMRKSLLALFQHDPKRYSVNHITGEPLKRFMTQISELGLLQLEEERTRKIRRFDRLPRGSIDRNQIP
jgi:hypothetical protein